LLFPISRQVLSHPQESRAPSCVTVTWEDKSHHSRCSPPSSFSQLYVLSLTSYGMEYPALPAVSPPGFLWTPTLLTGGVAVRSRKGPDSVSTAQQ